MSSFSPDIIFPHIIFFIPRMSSFSPSYHFLARHIIFFPLIVFPLTSFSSSLGCHRFPPHIIFFPLISFSHEIMNASISPSFNHCHILPSFFLGSLPLMGAEPDWIASEISVFVSSEISFFVSTFA